MVTYGWGTNHSVEDWLFAEGYRFDFYQAVRLLEMLPPPEATADFRALAKASVGEEVEPSKEAIQFKSRVGLDFPAASIASIRPATPTQPAQMDVQFMGLAGLLGPLPNNVTETILQRLQKKDRAFQDFLDIFNHRLISLMYRIRRKHRLGVAFVAPEDHKVSQYLLSMIGLGMPSLQKRLAVPERALLFYAGILAQQPRSMVGLEQILSDYFLTPVKVLPFQGQWLELDDSQQTQIGKEGQNHALGQTAVLGKRVWDQQSKFRLLLSDLSFEQVLDFLPTGRAFAPLCALTKFYNDDELDFDIQLRLKHDEIPSFRIGTLCGARLGWTSRLGNPATASDLTLTLAPPRMPPELQKLHIPFFLNLQPLELEAILRRLKRLKLPAHSVVVRQGELRPSFFLIYRGSLKFSQQDEHGQEIPLATLAEGEYFGEMLLITGQPHPATAITQEDSELLELSPAILEELLPDYPNLEKVFFPGWAELQTLIQKDPSLEPLLAKAYAARGKGKELQMNLEKAKPQLELLQKALFQGLTQDELIEVFGRANHFYFPPNGVVVHQGSPGTSLFVVLKGSFQIVRRFPNGQKRTIAQCQAGQVFGEISFWGGQPRTATVIATEPSEVLEFSRASLRQLIAKNAHIEALLRLLYEKHLRALSQLEQQTSMV